MNIYDFSAKKANGTTVPLSEYKGKVILIVNTASKCGFTPQLEGLESLYKKYENQNFIILGFPCNQFNDQDPGSNEEIQEFCKINYGVTFPVFAKIEVNGEGADPIFKYLKLKQGFSGFDSEHELASTLEEINKKIDENYKNNPDIKWNFTKFVIDKNGEVIKRFEPTATPEQIDPYISSLL